MNEFNFRGEPEVRDPPYGRTPMLRTGRTKLSFEGTIADAFAAELIAVIRKYTVQEQLHEIRYEIERLSENLAKDEASVAKRRAAIAELQKRRTELEAKL